MGLHSISADSQTLEFHCHNPACQYHNCANWESFLHCGYHDAVEFVKIPAAEMRARMSGLLPPDLLNKITDVYMTQPTSAGRRVGQTRQVSIDDSGIVWTGPGVVALPMCVCGTQMFLKVNFTPAELAAQNITRPIYDPQNPGTIIAIEKHPMVDRHTQLAAALVARGNVYMPS